MKKCPKCGNPSYDGAPTCGNCGYKFPKPKSEKKEVKSNDEDVVSIIKENKIVIGAILIITIIAICAIVLSGSGNQNNNESVSSVLNYTANDVSFNYPSTWNLTNLTDADHDDAAIFKDNKDNTIEYYTASADSSNLNDLTTQRISNAQYYGGNIETIEKVTLDDTNGTDIYMENADGSYTRYVSLLKDGVFYVFKIDGESSDSVNTSEITDMLNSLKL
ncbi:PsbP-related protein [Methanobrevibacter sp. DSM 116169]|uniref:PsbP-related protein n=1 Tax=Methanobrevibacter sp. DSM 116169 TaxID=3242727 RepID=UPI0038FC8D94